MILIECLNGLPTEYESFIIEKYDSFITSCRYIEVNYPNYDVYYMLVYESSVLIELIVFGNWEKTSTCFNSLVDIDQVVIQKCTEKIFEIFPLIKKIRIEASYKSYFLDRSFLIHRDNDQILTLPSTIEEYSLKLGYHTRKNIKNRKVRLLRDYPEVKFRAVFRIDIEKSLINKIIQLNYDRLKYKGIIPTVNELYIDNIYNYSQHYGCVTYLEIEGVIIAGCISTALNKGVFVHVISFDTDFSKYNVGEICMYYLIESSIERKMSTFHFLWGKTEFKKRFLAESHLLYSYFIYRAYSLDFFYRKIKAVASMTFNRIKLSKYSKPLRGLLKSYRKKYKCVI